MWVVGEQQRAERPVEDRTGEPVEVGASRETEDATDAGDGEAEADLDPGWRETGAHHHEERQRLPVRRRSQHTERGNGQRRDLQGERAAPITFLCVHEDTAAGHDREVDRDTDAAERRRGDGRRRATRQAEADLDRELRGSQRHRCGGHLDGDVGAHTEAQLWSSTFGRHSDAHAERLHVERADPARAGQGHVQRGIAVQHEAELRVRGDLHVDGGQFGPRDDRREQLGQQGGSETRQTEGEIDDRRRLVGTQLQSQVHAAAADSERRGWGLGRWIEIDFDAQLRTGRASGERRRAGGRHGDRERRRRVATQREVHTVHGRRLDRCRHRAGDDDLEAGLPVGSRSGDCDQSRRAQSSLRGENGHSPSASLPAEQSNRVGLSDQRVQASQHRRGAGVRDGTRQRGTVDAVEQLGIEGVPAPFRRGVPQPGEKLLDIGIGERPQHLHRRRPHLVEQLVPRRAHGRRL